MSPSRTSNWRAELREGLELILESALFDFVPTLEDAASCLDFCPERLESVLDVDAEVTTAVVEWLDLLDVSRSCSLSESLRSSIDSAAFGLDDPVVLRLRSSGEGDLLVPAIVTAALTRMFGVVLRTRADVGELEVHFDRRGFIVLKSYVPRTDPILSVFLGPFGIFDPGLLKQWCGRDGPAFGIDLSSFARDSSATAQ